MEFETLCDLLEAYQAGEIPSDCPLIIDEDEGIAYVERYGDEAELSSYDDDEGQGKYLFYLNLTQLLIEAINLLGIPIDNDYA